MNYTWCIMDCVTVLGPLWLLCLVLFGFLVVFFFLSYLIWKRCRVERWGDWLLLLQRGGCSIFFEKFFKKRKKKKQNNCIRSVSHLFLQHLLSLYKWLWEENFSWFITARIFCCKINLSQVQNSFAYKMLVLGKGQSPMQHEHFVSFWFCVLPFFPKTLLHSGEGFCWVKWCSERTSFFLLLCLCIL